MKKIISVIICVFICIFSITGCGGIRELDINSAVRELLNSNIFDETLTEVNKSVTEKRLAVNAEDIEICKAYAGTKAVVDEVIIIKAVSDTSAENIKAAFEKHIETQKKSYETYRPSELPKLEDAVIMSLGNYEVLVVSKDSMTARKTVKDCFK